MIVITLAGSNFRCTKNIKLFLKPLASPQNLAKPMRYLMQNDNDSSKFLSKIIYPFMGSRRSILELVFRDADQRDPSSTDLEINPSEFIHLDPT